MTRPVVINGRFQRQPLSGVQRTAREIVARLAAPHRVATPPSGMAPQMGHLWEQMVLPVRLGESLLWSPCNAGPLAARRHVVTIHDAAVLDHPEWFSARFSAIYRQLWPRLARSAKIVTVSEFSRERLSEQLDLPAERIAVVPNGVDARFAPATPDEIADVRQRYGLGEHLYFLALATVEPRKNLSLVLKAWRRALKDIPDARLVIAGAKGVSRVFAGAEEHETPPGIIMLGRTPDEDLPALISGARAMLYPSLYEGFGLPVLEAMACGTPAVTTRRASLPEVGGEAAIYVDAKDEEDLATALVDLAGDDDIVADHREAGLARAKQFSWDRAARSMEQIFAAY